MDFKIHLYTYIFFLMHVMDSIEGRDDGHVHKLRPENPRFLEPEPEQKNDNMLLGMVRLRPDEVESKNANSNSGDSGNEQINWLTQLKQYVSKLVMVSNLIPQNNVIYHVTKVVNFWNYNPRLTVVKFGISNDSSDGSNDSENDNEGAVSQVTTNSGWIGISNELLEDGSKAPKVDEKADNLGEEIVHKGMVMRRLILPASFVPKEKKSLLDLDGLLDTAGNLIGGVVGTVLGTGTGKKGAGGGGTSVDGNVDVGARHKRSLNLI